MFPGPVIAYCGSGRRALTICDEASLAQPSTAILCPHVDRNAPQPVHCASTLIRAFTEYGGTLLSLCGLSLRHLSIPLPAMLVKLPRLCCNSHCSTAKQQLSTPSNSSAHCSTAQQQLGQDSAAHRSTVQQAARDRCTQQQLSALSNSSAHCSTTQQQRTLQYSSETAQHSTAHCSARHAASLNSAHFLATRPHSCSKA